MEAPGTGAFKGTIFDDPALFIDRDSSLIEFQRRVFEEARDEDNPLLERLPDLPKIEEAAPTFATKAERRTYDLLSSAELPLSRPRGK